MAIDGGGPVRSLDIQPAEYENQLAKQSGIRAQRAGTLGDIKKNQIKSA